MNKIFKAALVAMTGPIGDAAAEGFADWARRIIEAWKKDAAEKGTTCPWDLYLPKGSSSKMSRSEYRTNRQRIENVSRFLTGNRGDEYRVADDVEDRIAALAKRHGDEVAAQFAAKLTQKLSKVFEASAPKTIEVKGTWSRNMIHVALDNGVKFSLLSQVVSVWPWNAIPHHRYPSTFHNVHDAEGNTTAKMSMDDLNKLVADIAGTKFVPQAQAKREAVQARKNDRRQAKADKELDKARKALRRALDRCERAATDFDIHSAKRDHDEAVGRLTRTLKRYNMDQTDEDRALLTEEPKLSLDDAEAAPAKLKSIKKALREAKKEEALFDADESNWRVDGLRKFIGETEAIKAKLEALVG
jgi:hypothetical protein